MWKVHLTTLIYRATSLFLKEVNTTTMELTDRQLRFINLLIKEPEMKSVAYFAKQLHVSIRTIHSDLKKVDTYSHELGFIIKRKRGEGIKLYFNQGRLTPSPTLAPKVLYGVKERRIQILKRLLFKHELITLSNLADDYFVSKSSINNDLTFIKKHFLNQTTVQLISSKQGTRIEGTEQEFQNTLVLFNTSVNKYELKKINFTEHAEQKYTFLKEFYGEEIVQICQDALYKYAVNKLDIIADYYVYNILNIVIVLTYRASLGHHIQTNINKPYYHINRTSF